MKSISYALILLLMTKTSVFGATADIPELENLTLEDIEYGGSGCPSGSTTIDLSEDKEAFTVVFSEFVASSDSLDDSRKNCDLNFSIYTPEKFEFAIVNIQIRGAVYVSDKTRAAQNVKIAMNGQKEKFEKLVIKGPFDDSYERVEQFPIEQIEWRGCKERNASFKLSTDIKINSNNNDLGEGYITVDSIDGESSQSYDLVWRSCDQPRKKFQAFCKAKLYKKGLLLKEIVAKGKNRSKDEAVSLAKTKLKSKCSTKENKDKKFPLSCEIESSCTIIEI